MEITLEKLYYKTVKRLDIIKSSNSKQEAIILIEAVTGYKKLDILTQPNNKITYEQIQKLNELIARREQHEPIQYIMGEQEFMGLTFKVNPSVLIPRQDTETLVESVIEYCESNKWVSLLDMCTGSGCIAISISALTNIKNIIAIDISEMALKVAKKNAVINHISNIEFIQSNLFEQLKHKYLQYFDCIVSNPPYIQSEDIQNLMREVKDYEPRLALDGKVDGLYYYRLIVKESKRFLKTNGSLFFEIGYNQADEVIDILLKEGYKNISVIKDLTLCNRVIKANR